MQYHIQTLVKHLFDKDSFEQVSVNELKQFTEDYPYAAVGQFLYAKKLKDSGAYNSHEQGEQASLYFHNALWLRWQLDKKEEAPVLPVRAEEQAQQPGFRIVVQMPKNGPAIYTPGLTEPEEKQEEEPALQTPPPPEGARSLSDGGTPQTPPPPGEAGRGLSLQVNEDGSLVEQVAEQVPFTTEDTLTPVAGDRQIDNAKEIDDIIPAVELTEGEADIDDVIPAVEVTPEMADPKAVPTEVDDIVPAVDTVEADTDDIIPAIDAGLAPPVEELPSPAAPPAEAPAGAEVSAAADTTPPEIPMEEQVEPVAGPVPAEEPAAPVAEQPQPVAPEASAVPEEPEAEEPAAAEQPNPFGLTPAGQDLKISVDPGEPIFESYHTIDYFASQGIKLMQADFKDKMGKQLKSFTDWLRSMKRIGGPIESNTSLDEVTNQSIQRIAEHSVEEKEVLTEAMAEVWAKQGNRGKAIRVYEKLSLLNPAKSTYFANRIEQLKAE